MELLMACHAPVTEHIGKAICTHADKRGDGEDMIDMDGGEDGGDRGMVCRSTAEDYLVGYLPVHSCHGILLFGSVCACACYLSTWW